MRPNRPSPAKMQSMCDKFNDRHPPGAKVEYWTGPREGVGKSGVVASGGACILGGHTAVVYIVGAGCVALSHVQPA